MKILHIIFSFTTGGAETMLVDILNEQVKKEKVELIIINNFFNKELIKKVDSRVKIHFINRKEGSLNPVKILKLNFLLFTAKPQIIHCHNHNAVGLIKLKGHAKVCLTAHDVNISTTYFKRYDKIFSISEAVREDILKRSNIETTLVYNGIYFDHIEQKKSFAKNTNDLFSIVQISRLNHKKKGQDVLIRAIEVLIKERGLCNIRLDLIGDPVYPQDKVYLEELVDKLKLREYVSFKGLRDRNYIYSHLKSYDLLVQPSIYEGFGLTIIEAMAAKLPVLVSNIEGPMEVIKGGVYGSYFQKGDYLDCANMIEFIINKSLTGNHFNSISESYDYACKNFNIKETALHYLEEYQKN